MTIRALPLAIAACHSVGTGADIEVTPPAGTAEVELLVAPDPCDDGTGNACAAGIAWPMLNEQPVGTIYSLDNDKRNAIPVTTSGQTVRFRLEPGETSHVDRLAVIAFDGAGNASAAKLLSDVTIPSAAQIWKVDLDTITPIGSMLGVPAPNGPTKLTEVWRAPVRSTGGSEDPSQLASCFAQQSWDADKAMWEREFLAPTQDADCDNQMIECNSYWYDYGATAGGSPCLTATSPFAPACVIGASLCADGRSSTTSCTYPPANNVTVCVPDSLCACNDPGKLASCVRNVVDAALAGTSALTYADCGPFPVDSTTNSGPCTSNNENQMVLQLPLSNALHISVGLLGVPFGAALATDNGSFPVGTAMFTLQADPSNGTVQLTWDKGSPPLVSPDLLLDVQYTALDILVPLKIGFGTPMPCPSGAQNTSCILKGRGSADNEFHCPG